VCAVAGAAVDGRLQVNDLFDAGSREQPPDQHDDSMAK
jgi:hypothetical protein